MNAPSFTGKKKKGKGSNSGLNDLLDSHPEAICKKCKGPNITWYAPSEIWNNHHNGYDILCPICFAKMAEKEGCVPTAWVIAPEAI